MSSDELDDLHHDILAVLEDGRATPSYLAAETGESRQLISNRLRDLRLTGDVERIHKGLYELTHATGEDVPPHELRTADDDLVELVESDAVEWDVNKTSQRVHAVAVFLTRIRRGARYTVTELEDIVEEFDLDLEASTFRKAVNASVEATDGVFRTQTSVYWSTR